MRPFALWLAAFLVLPFTSLSAQVPSSVDSSHQLENSTPRNQIALDAGVLLAFSPSYVRRLNNRELDVGVGLGFAWELNLNTFNANIWNALFLAGFVRYQVAPVLHFDLGATVLMYDSADDGGGFAETFLGLHSAVMVGYRFVFIGTNVRCGWLSEGSEFGGIISPQVRIVIPWG